MCDCSRLPGKWWAKDGSSDREVASRGWQQAARVGAGWAVLWKCAACGQYWQGIVACSASSQDCIEKYAGNDEDWFNSNVQKYEQCVEDGNTRKEAYSLASQYQQKGYETKCSPTYDPVFGTVPWMYTVICRKQGSEKVFALTLAHDGGVCIKEE